jgi:hypothetical protein
MPLLFWKNDPNQSQLCSFWERPAGNLNWYPFTISSTISLGSVTHIFCPSLIAGSSSFIARDSRKRIVAPRLNVFCFVRVRCSVRPAFSGAVAIAHSKCQYVWVRAHLQCRGFVCAPSLQIQYHRESELEASNVSGGYRNGA